MVKLETIVKTKREGGRASRSKGEGQAPKQGIAVPVVHVRIPRPGEAEEMNVVHAGRRMDRR